MLLTISSLFSELIKQKSHQKNDEEPPINASISLRFFKKKSVQEKLKADGKRGTNKPLP